MAIVSNFFFFKEMLAPFFIDQEIGETYIIRKENIYIYIHTHKRGAKQNPQKSKKK